jgi:hypothetical protein
MSIGGKKKTIVIAAIPLLLLGSLAFTIHSVSPRLDIRGNLPQSDLAAIYWVHRSRPASSWMASHAKWFPSSVQKIISGPLNPIETITVPSTGQAIVVYRAFDCVYYDKKGKHHWGAKSYALTKDSKGWH